MTEGEKTPEQQIPEQPSPFIDLKPLQELFLTPEGRALFEQRIREGLETYTRVVSNELPALQRPEFQLSEEAWHKIY